MIYHVLDNFKVTETRTTISPLTELAAVQPNQPAGLVDKDSRQKWLHDPRTKWALLSTWEALNPRERISSEKGNPPAKLHGLIVDYDAPSPGTVPQIGACLQDILGTNSPLLPQWIVTSPSENHRLVWEFSEGLNIIGISDPMVLSLIEELKRLFKLKHLLAGLDEGALKAPNRFYDIGGKWMQFNNAPLPIDEIRGAWVEAVKKVGRVKGGPVEIPMDIIEKEIHKQFPGRWPKGLTLEDGTLGPAVWDSSTKNPKSCIWRPWGVVSFRAKDSMFKSYAEIFGKDFVRKWEENKIGSAVADIYYLPKVGYYRKFDSDGHWRSQPKEDLTLFLAGKRGLSRAAGPAKAPSEVEQALVHLQEACVIDGAIPVVYDRREIVLLNNQRLLNTARIKVLEPDLSIRGRKWGEGFPYISKWLWQFFSSRKELVYFLTWLKHFYMGAYTGTITRGHALFIVGEVAKGKTLLNMRLIPHLMGGGVNPSKFLVGGEEFNKNLLEAAHWHVDDSEAASDRVAHKKFSEKLKALIANPMIDYRPMYVDRMQIPFNGRVCVTLNGDSESLMMIPDLDRNIAEKLIILRTNPKSNWTFSTNQDTESKLFADAAAFAGWLHDWEPPSNIYGPGWRFGMKDYINAEMRTEATKHGFDADILGLLDILWTTDDEWVQLAAKDASWEGTAAELTKILASHSSLSKLLNGMTVKSVGMRLSKLSKVPGTGVSKAPDTSKHKGSSARYAIRKMN